VPLKVSGLSAAYSQVFLRARDIVLSRLTYITCSENTLFARDYAALRDLEARKRACVLNFAAR